MDLLLEFVKLLGNILYFTYESLVHGCIDIWLLNVENEEFILKNKTLAVMTINKYFIDTGVDISWKTLEFVGAVKKYYNKSIVPYFHHITNDFFKKSITIINNGEVVMLVKDKNAFNELNLDNNGYDMIFYTDYSLNDSKRNYTSILDDKNVIKNISNVSESKSSVNFIIFQLTVNDVKYDINLKEPYNFLVKNNTLKEPFFKWYMKHFYNVKLNNDFSVNYMSQDMSIGKLHSPFFIKFNESSVTSFSSGKPKTMEVINEKEDSVNDEEEFVDETEDSGVVVNKIITDILNSERLKSHLD